MLELTSTRTHTKTKAPSIRILVYCTYIYSAMLHHVEHGNIRIRHVCPMEYTMLRSRLSHARFNAHTSEHVHASGANKIYAAFVCSTAAIPKYTPEHSETTGDNPTSFRLQQTHTAHNSKRIVSPVLSASSSSYLPAA